MFRCVMLLLAAALAATVAFGQEDLAATRPVSRDEILRLMSDLDDDAYKVRQAAQARLLELGPVVAPILREALDKKLLPPEAKLRAEFIVSRVWIPAEGVVWRDNPFGPAPEGIRDGDVIVACDGHRIRNGYELFLALGYKANPTFTVWRKGEPDFTTSFTRGHGLVIWGFRSWPDR